MMDTDSLEIKLCLKFCPYYKPGKNEELACKGFTVVEQLIQKGGRIVFEKYGLEFDKNVLEILRQRMCLACAFHEQDCDFMLDQTARPCGGFVLISQLLGSGVIALEEIR
jgi:hypothetical protein